MGEVESGLKREIRLIGELAEKILRSIKKMSKMDDEKGKKIASGEALLSWNNKGYKLNIIGAARDILVGLGYIEEITEGSEGGIVRTFYSLTSKGEECLRKNNSQIKRQTLAEFLERTPEAEHKMVPVMQAFHSCQKHGASSCQQAWDHYQGCDACQKRVENLILENERKANDPENIAFWDTG